MFSVVLSSVHTKSRIFQLLMPSQQEGWRGTGSWEGTQLGQLTQTDQRDMPDHRMSGSAYKLGKKKEWGDVQSDGVCLPKSPLRVMEPCFPGDGCTPACRWEVGNEFLVLLCLHVWLLLYLLNCLYLNPRVFSLLLFRFSPPSHWGGSERAAVWCLVAGWG